MHLQKSAGGAATPWQRLVRALIRRFLRAFQPGARAGTRSDADLDRLDLDQRVLEVGEW